MNGLTLRIAGRVCKSKPSALGICTVVLPLTIKETFCNENQQYKDFLNASSADEQLAILKTLLVNAQELNEGDFIRFLVLTYYYADVKHPVKCFLTRHITKSPNLQPLFAETLSGEIIKVFNTETNEITYRKYIDTVPKVICCGENFPTGAIALKSIEISLFEYMSDALECCVYELRNNENLSPTQKNEIFNLAHITLRAVLNIAQKVDPGNRDQIIAKCPKTYNYLVYMFGHSEVPMDTKSICGILYLTMYILENEFGSWVDFLQSEISSHELRNLFTYEAAELSLYSAIVTVVPPKELQNINIDQRSALLVLSEKIMNIAERNTSESWFVLCVTRTLVQLCKMLDKVLDSNVGMLLLEMYLVFVWGHLEHYMDSVRHLTAQALSAIVKYCVQLQKQGQNTALNNLFEAIQSLSMNRKAYFVSVTALAQVLGASCIIGRMPRAIDTLINALNIQAVQASATATLETLLQKHVNEVSTEDIYEIWIAPILRHITSNSVDSSVLNVLENVLSKAVQWNSHIMDFILPHINVSNTSDAVSTVQSGELKCILVLVNVARKAGVIANGSGYQSSDQWKGIVSYNVLKIAAINNSEETRILSLSLIVDTPKLTEQFSERDLHFVLYFLKYNINTQSPNFRQQMLSLLKKFIKRLEDSYKVIKRQKESQTNADKVQYYLTFVENLGAQCYDSLLLGANYSRRYIALQILVWCELIQLEGYTRVWKKEYVEKLLLHLDDSYETNKMHALNVLEHCPLELLMDDKYSTSIQMAAIFRQASSVKPTDCLSAAYKFKLIKNKLPQRVLEGKSCDIAEAVSYHLIGLLFEKLQEEVLVAKSSILVAASQAPMYGLLHCICQLLKDVDCSATSNDSNWTMLIKSLVDLSMDINNVVGPVVNNSSPEGHLPMDFQSGAIHLEGDGLLLGDGTAVTAQMVLLCAWRSVKEVSLVLGEICSRFSVEGESPGNLTPSGVLLVGEHFMRLLAETKHRGAFEQAYVGFTMLLTRLWRSRSPDLHGAPARWLTEWVEVLGGTRGLCGSRRGAGLPYMIQALVSTELQVSSAPSRFDRCMTRLVELAGGEGAAGGELSGGGGRAVTVAVLRALYRHAALGERVAGHVEAGLRAALVGFQRDSWGERNAWTLLLSALVVRIFGVQRSRDWDVLCTRNKMTGRIFFLRYPLLYDFMLEILRECCEDEGLLRPSLFPVLLLLSRLYPSALEGTDSNLKLVCFVPHVLRCAGSCVLRIRQLSARALLPLISPHQYLSHLEAMFVILYDRRIKTNYCHGILLQIRKLLESKPEELCVGDRTRDDFVQHWTKTLWILEQVLSRVPCYVVVDEYVKIVNLIIWRFPLLINQEIIHKMEVILEGHIFVVTHTFSYPGHDLCLANSLYLYLIILYKYNKDALISTIIRSLRHNSYQVILASLNYILILHDNFEMDNVNNFHKHWIEVVDKINTLKLLQSEINYIDCLCGVLKSNKYMECTQKCLSILSLEKDTQRRIVELKCQKNKMADDAVIKELIGCVQREHDNLTHIYLKCLLKFVTSKLNNKDLDGGVILEVMGIVNQCSSSEKNDNTRRVVVEFLQENCLELFTYEFVNFGKDFIFELKATVWATITTLIEDDDDDIRQSTAMIVVKLTTNVCKEPDSSILPSRAAECVRDIIRIYHEDVEEATALYLLLALLDFKSEVCLTDELSDECRVFDQNEKYNIFLEESIWTVECMKIIKNIQKSEDHLRVVVHRIITNNLYRNSFSKLCNINFKSFQMLLAGEQGIEMVNTKVDYIFNMIN